MGEMRRKTEVDELTSKLSGGAALSQGRSEVRTKSPGVQAGTASLLSPTECGQ